jgi:DNA-directed RNA polymerase subunit RPC12/RpoP
MGEKCSKCGGSGEWSVLGGLTKIACPKCNGSGKER